MKLAATTATPLLLLAALTAPPAAAQSTPGPRPVDPRSSTPAVQRYLAESSPRFRAFVARHPGTWMPTFDEDSQSVLAIVGSGLPVAPRGVASLDTARALAEEVLAAESDLWGTDLGNLRFREGVQSGPLFAFRWQQTHEGLEVAGSFVEVILHRAGRVVWLGSSAFDAPANVRALVTVPPERAQAIVASGKSLLARDSVETRDLLIFGVRQRGSIEARPAWAVEVSQPSRRVAERVLVDAGTGAILEVRSRIFEADVHGKVSAALQPNLTPLSSTQVLPIPGVTVTVQGAGAAVTNDQGDFSIPVSGSGPFTVSVALQGPNIQVLDAGGSPATASVSASVDPNGGFLANLDPNPSPNEEKTAQVSMAYLQSLVRAWMVGKLPGYTNAFPGQPSYVNEPSTCNAYFSDADGSMHFFHSGGGCVNTAYSTVIDHEFGHGVDAHFGAILSAGLSEGVADVVAMFHTGQGIVGQDFFGPGTAIRNGDNGVTWPATGCNFEPHCMGETYMGFAWQLRKKLIASLGASQGAAVADQIVLGAFPLNASSIPLAVQHTFLLDDDDANLANGTPHFADIAAAAAMKGFTTPAALGLSIAHVAHPDTWNQTVAYPVIVDVTALPGYAVGSVQVQWSDDEGQSFQTLNATATAAPGRYRTEIPAHTAPAVLHYRIVVTNQAGVTASFPQGDGLHRFAVGVRNVLFSESFEGGAAGWTHGASAGADDWEIGTGGATEARLYGLDPAAAVTGTRWAGTDLGLGAGGKSGFYEVNVSTYLSSPSISAAGKTNVRLRYQRWLSVEGSQYDVAKVKVSGATVWTNPYQPEMVDPGWLLQDLRTAAADNDSSFKVRFELSSDAGLQFGGWNVDDLEVYALGATPVGTFQMASNAPTIPLGTNLVLTSQGAPGAYFEVYLSGSPGPFPVPGFGLVEVGADALFFYAANLDGGGQHQFALGIPNIPQLSGLALYFAGFENVPGGLPQICKAIAVTLQ